MRHRAAITQQLRAAKAHIKSLLLYHRLTIPMEDDNPNWTKAFINWLKEIKWCSATGKLCLESKLRVYEFIYGEYLELANQLRSHCRKQHKQDYYLLKSIPGIGGYLASALIAELGDIRRFGNEASFASYIGLIPMMRNSGGTENVFGITPSLPWAVAQLYCRGCLGCTAFGPTDAGLLPDPYRQEPKSIMVKIARKLLNRILSVIKTEKPYEINYQKPLGMA